MQEVGLEGIDARVVGMLHLGLGAGHAIPHIDAPIMPG